VAQELTDPTTCEVARREVVVERGPYDPDLGIPKHIDLIVLADDELVQDPWSIVHQGRLGYQPSLNRIPTPAPDCASRRGAARHGASRCDRHEAEIAHDLLCPDRGGRIPNAELPVVVPSPAPRGAVGLQSTPKPETHRQRGEWDVNLTLGHWWFIGEERRPAPRGMIKLREAAPPEVARGQV